MIILSLILSVSLTAISLICTYHFLARFLKIKEEIHFILILLILGLILLPVYYILTIQISIRLFVYL